VVEATQILIGYFLNHFSDVGARLNLSAHFQQIIFGTVFALYVGF